MADTKITALSALTAADPANDVLPIVDVNDPFMAASGTTKKISINNILGASGTATLASATISGNLTLSAGTANGVGYLNASKVLTAGSALIFDGTNLGIGGTGQLRFATSGGAIGDNYIGTENSFSMKLHCGRGSTSSIEIASDKLLFYTSASERYRIASDGVATWSNVGGGSGTAMTLNATGLGVGGSPTAKISCAGYSSANQLPDINIARSSSGTAIQTGPNIVFTDGTSNNTVTLQNSQGRFGVWNYGAGSWNERLIVDSSGNVGIGVTPSAWSAGGFVQLPNSRAFAFAGAAGDYISNGYYDGSWKYTTTAAVSRYRQDTGSHQWFTAPSGTAGQTTTVTSGNSYTIAAAGGTNYTTFGAANNNVGTTFTATSSGTGNGGGVTQNIVFTQAMTLDASGNLLVGKTVANGTVKGTINQADGTIWSTLVDSTSASNTLLVYSTGAAAYRFYVNLAGTVFATNTTISGISDARLKENVQDLDVGLNEVLALKPRKFDWKEGKGKNIKGDRGFIAQEFETVFPNLIDEWKDEAPEGEAPYKSVRQDLIPVLVKAIQELTARVQTLETR